MSCDWDITYRYEMDSWILKIWCLPNGYIACQRDMTSRFFIVLSATKYVVTWQQEIVTIYKKSSSSVKQEE